MYYHITKRAKQWFYIFRFWRYLHPKPYCSVMWSNMSIGAVDPNPPVQLPMTHFIIEYWLKLCNSSVDRAANEVKREKGGCSFGSACRGADVAPRPATNEDNSTEVLQGTLCIKIWKTKHNISNDLIWLITNYYHEQVPWTENLYH